MRSSRVGGLLVIVLVGCGGGTAHPPCNVDDDCAAGTYCAPGVGCDFVCRVDDDCAPLGGGTCDERGRCVGGAMDGGAVDAGADAAAGCTSDAMCDDGDACTSDACTGGACTSTPIPDCVPCDHDHPDADGDGVDSIACGGSDCDDADGERYPGNTELCDDGHDEDCDPDTLGPDADGDGYAPRACCNGSVCGTDCDDTSMNVSPEGIESCNSVDDDCNGLVDDDAGMFFYDGDHDGYGRDDVVVRGCTAPAGYVATGGDCDDTDTGREINPAAMEVCDTIDNNCDGTPDVLPTGPCDCTIGDTQMCGPRDGSGAFITVGACRTGTQNCISGGWGECVGDVEPSNPPAANETACNAIDDDCDGTADDGLLIDCLPDGDSDRYAGGSTITQRCPDAARPSYGSCPAGYVAPSASLGTDCDDGNGGIWQLLSVRTDVDGDGYCSGGARNECSGSGPNAGTRYASTCSGDDCNDGDGGAYRVASLYVDADGDGWCTGTETRCIGATTPAGYATSCSAYSDCAPGNPAAYQNVDVRFDIDSDTWCNGGVFSMCVGPRSPTYLYPGAFGNRREAWNCVGGASGGNDCHDVNSCASASCDLIRVQVIDYLGHSCPGSRYAGPTPVSCPAGWQPATMPGWDGCRRDYRGVGGGFCSVGGDPYSGCTISQTCNFLEATACGVEAYCEPAGSYVGGC